MCSSELICVPYDQAGAYYSRDALAKALYHLCAFLFVMFFLSNHRYERLFCWMIDRINTSIHTNINRKDYQVIGLLDMYLFALCFGYIVFAKILIGFIDTDLRFLK